MAQKNPSKCNDSFKEEKLTELIETFEEIFKNLQYSINKKDLHDLILDGTRLFNSEDTLEHQKPEDYTKQSIIRPLFKVLDYEAKNIGGESGQDLDVYRRWADYNLIIKNENVLVEAEPLNKDLRTKKSGIDQVKEWILSKKTKTNFGIATNGFLWIMVKYDENAKIIRKLKTIDLRPVFVDFINQGHLDNNDKEILKEFYRSFSNDKIISVFKEISGQLEEYQEKISQKFYSEYMDFVLGIDSKTGSSSKRGYSLLTAIKSPDKNDDDIRMFAITFMNRIIFIKFLEDKGLVNKNLFKELWNNFSDIQKTIPTSFYKMFLEPLFFGVFNTPPKERLDAVKKIKLFEGIPYLNGGLFSRWIPKELEYDVEDDILKKIIIDFIEGYIFTISGEKGLDPDILGYIFEKTITLSLHYIDEE
ncbi:MAG: type I restriction enzyme HsdR N-terminal domain-containing protein [Euryarchaeota archaeon]|nr:type I restriction enzyme HsdR N-terminal domain-containing protein [Euryarchaeota archaeon]